MFQAASNSSTTTADGGLAATCAVTDLTNTYLTSSDPNGDTSSIATGDTITAGASDTLTATITPSDAANQGLTWTSSNNSVATVVYDAATGMTTITGVSAGTATITATTADGGYTATCQVTVTAGGGSTYSVYDINEDGQVNVLDLQLVGQHFTTS